MTTANIPLMPVASTQIHAIGHCPTTDTLAIQFFHKGGPGNVYHYSNFSQADYTAFAGAKSLGAHFKAHIKTQADKYPYVNKGVPAAPRAAAPAPAPPARHQLRDALALLLNGREYTREITKEEEALANSHGLLVIFGASDDLMEFRGAAHDEVGCYNGGSAFIDHLGLLPSRESLEDEGDDALKAYFARQPGAKQVDALWASEEGYSWTFKTEVPHATFEIVEDGEPYCRGIVIDMADLAPVLP